MTRAIWKRPCINLFITYFTRADNMLLPFTRGQITRRKLCFYYTCKFGVISIKYVIRCCKTISRDDITVILNVITWSIIKVGQELLTLTEHINSYLVFHGVSVVYISIITLGVLSHIGIIYLYDVRMQHQTRDIKKQH
jgi:hypothetical protein